MVYEKLVKERETKFQEVVKTGKPLPKRHVYKGKSTLLRYFFLRLEIFQLNRVLKKIKVIGGK